jgi:hypothetical protein
VAGGRVALQVPDVQNHGPFRLAAADQGTQPAARATKENGSVT